MASRVDIPAAIAAVLTVMAVFGLGLLCCPVSADACHAEGRHAQTQPGASQVFPAPHSPVASQAVLHADKARARHVEVWRGNVRAALLSSATSSPLRI